MDTRPRSIPSVLGSGLITGAVTLTGMVQTTNQKYTAEQIAWQVPGVQGLTNNLSVSDAQATPESADDKLARRVEFELEGSSTEKRADPRCQWRGHSDRHGFFPCGKAFGGRGRKISGRRSRRREQFGGTRGNLTQHPRPLCFSGLVFVIGRHMHAV
jgi:BON domain-containing protein